MDNYSTYLVFRMIIYAIIVIMFFGVLSLFFMSLFKKNLRKIPVYLLITGIMGLYIILTILSHDIYRGTQELRIIANTDLIYIEDISNIKRFRSDFFKKYLVDGQYGFITPELVFKILEEGGSNFIVIYSYGYDLDDDGGFFITPHILHTLIPVPLKNGDILILKQRLMSKNLSRDV